MESIREVDILLRAAYPIISIVSHEEMRVEAALRHLISEKNSETGESTVLWRWSCTEGLLELKEDGESHEDVQSPFEILDFVRSFDRSGIFLLRDFHHFLKGEDAAPPIIRKMRDLAHYLSNDGKGKRVILLGCRVNIPEDLEKVIAVVEFNLPDRQHIEEYLLKILGYPGLDDEKSRLVNDPFLRSKIVDALLGLTTFEIESVVAKSIVEASKIVPGIIIKDKKNIIKKSGVLEFYEPDSGMKSVGGLENLKGWLAKRARAFTPEAREFNLPAPKGVLLIGIPGTGKSLISKAIGSSWNMPILRMDVGALFGQYVGQSESNMRKALKTAEAMSPCILWIDELEKAFSGTSGSADSGTSARVFGSFLSWMQEKTSSVFVTATANDVTALPPELLRKGRFDEIFFVDLPSPKDRKEILSIHLGRYGRSADSFDTKMVADAAEAFSGAELESVVVSGLFSAFEDRRELGTADLLIAVNSTVPLAKTMSDQINFMRDWASDRAVPANKYYKETPGRNIDSGSRVQSVSKNIGKS